MSAVRTYNEATRLEGRLRKRVVTWRKAAKRMRKEVKDSPSHDLQRMINERMEAVEICANELEAELGQK